MSIEIFVTFNMSWSVMPRGWCAFRSLVPVSMSPAPLAVPVKPDTNEQIARHFRHTRQLRKVTGHQSGHQHQADREDFMHRVGSIAAKNRTRPFRSTNCCCRPNSGRAQGASRRVGRVNFNITNCEKHISSLEARQIRRSTFDDIVDENALFAKCACEETGEFLSRHILQMQSETLTHGQFWSSPARPQRRILS